MVALNDSIDTNMSRFISCDWGTSVFRIRLVESENLKILAEFSSPEGIAATYSQWKAQHTIPRLEFYTSILQKNLQQLQGIAGSTLATLPVVLSGMASSSIGMMELPYRNIPCSPAGRELNWERVNQTDRFDHPIILISGLRSENDVMRGEETKLAGLSEHCNQPQQLVIMPGTHAKHVIIQQGIVTGFKTHMTGELFDLLTNKSVLSTSVVKAPFGKEYEEAFLRGFMLSEEGNILHHLFRVRTNDLFRKELPEANYHYLSGLLIGEELRQYRGQSFHQTILLAAGPLQPLYALGLHTIGLGEHFLNINADEALIKGQARILQQIH